VEELEPAEGEAQVTEKETYYDETAGGNGRDAKMVTPR
jgi:hypothetical protein